MNEVHGFRGEYNFLSNFYLLYTPLLEVFKGVTIQYKTVEHAFQASKVMSLPVRILISNCDTPGEAKRVGRTVKLREDWESVKVDIMRHWVDMKFNTDTMIIRLLSTKNMSLIEVNKHRDTFWGTDMNLRGSNTLGKIIMDTRRRLQTHHIVFT